MSLPIKSDPSNASAYQTLSARDRRFVDAYFVCKTQTAAALQADPSCKRPDVLASKLMRKPAITAAIDELRQNVLSAVGIRQEMIVRELGVLAFGDIRALYDDEGRLKPMKDLTEDQAALISGLDTVEIFADPKQSDLFGQTDGAGRVVIGLSKKLKRTDKLAALRELKEIANLGGSSQASTIFNVQINY